MQRVRFVHLGSFKKYQKEIELEWVEFEPKILSDMLSFISFHTELIGANVWCGPAPCLFERINLIELARHYTTKFFVHYDTYEDVFKPLFIEENIARMEGYTLLYKQEMLGFFIDKPFYKG